MHGLNVASCINVIVYGSTCIALYSKSSVSCLCLGSRGYGSWDYESMALSGKSI